MFSNFKTTFIKKPQYTLAPPQAIIDSLNTELPEGFYYVHDHDGYCRLENGDGINLSHAKVDIPKEDQCLFDKSKATADDIRQYCYNTQTPLRIIPDENGCYNVNGKNIKATDFIKAPMKNIEPKSMCFYMHPPKFPLPFNVQLKGDGHELTISIRRVAAHSLSAQKFESVFSSPIKLSYTLDTKVPNLSMSISINVDGVSSISDIVAANHIYNACIKGEAFLFDSRVASTPNKEVSPISEETIVFWDKVLEIEKVFSVEFDASKGVTYNEGNKILELHRSLIEKQPFKNEKTFNSVSGNGNSHDVTEAEEIIGKEIYFELIETEDVSILGKTLSYFGLVSIFGATVKAITIPQNETSGHFNIELSTTEGKKMYSATMYFISEEDLTVYQKETEHMKTFENSEEIEYLI